MKTITEFSTLALRRAAAAKTSNATLEGDALTEALAAALSIPVERVPRVLETLEIVGDRIERVRLVRVFQGEKGPHGAESRGEFHYSVDYIASVKPKTESRDENRGGGRGRSDGGGRGGPGGRGDRDKPKGLGSLKALLNKDSAAVPEGDDRPARGEMPRAGMGWQLTSAPREFRDGGAGRGGPKRGGPRRDNRGPGGDRPGGDRPRGPRPQFDGGGPRQPRLGPDGQPLPPRGPRVEARISNDGVARQPRPPRERKPMGPDANGNGPDGQPWDPARLAIRQAERAARTSQPVAAPEATEKT